MLNRDDYCGDEVTILVGMRAEEFLIKKVAIVETQAHYNGSPVFDENGDPIIEVEEKSAWVLKLKDRELAFDTPQAADAWIRTNSDEYLELCGEGCNQVFGDKFNTLILGHTVARVDLIEDCVSVTLSEIARVKYKVGVKISDLLGVSVPTGPTTDVKVSGEIRVFAVSN